MIRVNILYPTKPGGRFDFDYYLNKHIPMSKALLGPALKGIVIEQGMMGAPPQVEPPYVALCHMTFESIEVFLAAFMPNAAQLQGDIANYTDSEPVIQFSAVMMG